MDPLLSIDRLTKRFGPLTAVDGVSFELKRGEVLGFLGPNGAGKSTTMRMITGYLPPTSGRVTVGGLDLAKAPIEVRRRIGYLPEGAPAYGDMTPLGLLRFAAALRGFGAAAQRERIDAMVDLLELKSVLRKPVETLSKGFKRRVGLELPHGRGRPPSRRSGGPGARGHRRRARRDTGRAQPRRRRERRAARI